MGNSIKRTLACVVVLGAIYIGFIGGRNLATGQHLRHRRQEMTRQLSASIEGGMGFAQDNGSNAPPAEVFENVLDHVQRDFVEESGSNYVKLNNGSLATMLASLDDPKTAYLEPPMRQAKQDAWQGRFHGIGAILTVTKSKKLDVEYRHLSVVDVMPGSPAEKAGIKSGDRITDIDGHWIIAYSPLVEAIRLSKEKDDEVRKKEAEILQKKFSKGYTLFKALPYLITGEGKPLKIQVERDGVAKPLSLELTTAITQVEPVDYRVVGNKVGYLKIRQFHPKTILAVQSALGKLGSGLKGLVVDLRGNPGGVQSDAKTGVDGFDAVRKLLGMLTRGGSLGMIEYKPNQPEKLTIAPTNPSVKLPLVVLVDQGTANLSELVALTLRKATKAKIIGTRTFGDPILQLFTVLKTGAGIEMSHAKLGGSAQDGIGKGIEPDIAVITTGGANNDVALAKALAVLGG